MTVKKEVHGARQGEGVSGKEALLHVRQQEAQLHVAAGSAPTRHAEAEQPQHHQSQHHHTHETRAQAAVHQVSGRSRSMSPKPIQIQQYAAVRHVGNARESLTSGASGTSGTGGWHMTHRAPENVGERPHNVGDGRAADPEAGDDPALEESDRKRRRMWEQQGQYAASVPPGAGGGGAGGCNGMAGFAAPFGDVKLGSWPPDSDALANPMSALNPMNPLNPLAARSAAGAAGNGVMIQQLASMQQMLALHNMLTPHSMNWGRPGRGGKMNNAVQRVGPGADDDAVDGIEKNKNCHFCEHAPKRCAIFACLDPVCDQMFCENCMKRHLGRPTSFKGQQDASAANWRCPICIKVCCCTQQICNMKHLHCKRYRRRIKQSSKRVGPGGAQDGRYLGASDHASSATAGAGPERGDSAVASALALPRAYVLLKPEADKGEGVESGSGDEDAPGWQQQGDHAGEQHNGEQPHDPHTDHLHQQLPVASRKMRDQHFSRLVNGSGTSNPAAHWQEDGEEDGPAQVAARLLGRQDSRLAREASSASCSIDARAAKVFLPDSGGEIARLMGTGALLRRPSESISGAPGLTSLATGSLSTTALATPSGLSVKNTPNLTHSNPLTPHQVSPPCLPQCPACSCGCWKRAC